MNNKTNSSKFDKTETTLTPQAIEELYEYVKRRGIDEPNFVRSVASMYERNARWSNPAIRAAVHAAAFVLAPRNSSIKYFFVGTKFQEIILGLPRHEICVIGGPKQLAFCLKHRIPFICNMSLWNPIFLGLQDKSHSNKALTSIIKKTEHQLRNKAHHSATLIVDNDSLPMQRAIILSGRLAHLKSVCIQDGIFQSKSPGHIIHGWFADEFLAINKHQRNMLIAKGMHPQKIGIMGFHSSPYRPKRPISPTGQRKVCFLGQPWHKYDPRRSELYLKIVTKTASILHNAGIEMAFKPHPWEMGAHHLKNISNVVVLSLHEAFENYDVFISLTSTSLIEAQAAGRVAIQIKDNTFDADALSEHGEIIVIDYTNDPQMPEKLLESLNAAPPFLQPEMQPAANRFILAMQGYRQCVI